MNGIRLTLLGLILSLPLALPASADELLVDRVAAGAAVQSPQRGVTMDQVRQQFGAPVKEYPTVSVNGGPHRPPITRWDYNDFSVFFEKNRVIHSVVHHTAAR